MTILSSCLDIDSVREYPPSTLACKECEMASRSGLLGLRVFFFEYSAEASVPLPHFAL